MSKLFNLKSWLTLDEAAEYLGRALQEAVSVPDVLRLATGGHLVLSVNFVNHATANMGRMVSFDEARLVLLPHLAEIKPFELEPNIAALLKEFPRGADRRAQHEWLLQRRELADHPKIIVTIEGDRVADDQVLEWESSVTSIEGVWDIPIHGGAALDVEHLLQSYVGGPEVTLTCLNGAYVVSDDGSKFARLLEHMADNPYITKDESLQSRIERARKYPHGDPASYYPRGGLPEDAVIVVRPAALARFVASLAGSGAATEGRPLATRERNNLLRITVALAKEAKIDIQEGKGGAAAVEAALAACGFDGPRERTIRDILKQAREVE